ncbi:hypothetical protein F4861DRAFT_413784 [Xylaria intraflava]|nr:hypothetical protein F4861DRAFT_413784 [Xylaria intraflava]
MSSSDHDDKHSPERPAGSPIPVGSGVGPTPHARRIKKKRVRNFTENDRAAHRIFEKSRREAFKEALTNLANLLPALTDTEPQRLSKHVVVDESIAFIKSQHEQIRTVTEHLQTVKTERDELLAEVNHWRSSAGIEPRRPNTFNQPAIRHGSTGATTEAILGTLPTTLQPTAPSIHIASEAAPPFIPNPLHEGNPSSLRTDASASMHWESFESQIHPFGTHLDHVQGEMGPNGIGNPNTAQIAAYQPPQPTNMQHFNSDRGQHEAVFLPFEPPQTFNPQSFPGDTFIQNTSPLQDYMPP